MYCQMTLLTLTKLNVLVMDLFLIIAALGKSIAVFTFLHILLTYCALYVTPAVAFIKQ